MTLGLGVEAEVIRWEVCQGVEGWAVGRGRKPGVDVVGMGVRTKARTLQLRLGRGCATD